MTYKYLHICNFTIHVVGSFLQDFIFKKIMYKVTYSYLQ